MSERLICKVCNHHVSYEKFYHQGGICKDCRSKKEKEKREGLNGLELAEYLLHRSCVSVLDRVRSDKKEAYKGVECTWDKPSFMKEDLMEDEAFWGKWVEQSRIYEENNRVINLRPTIDRIESDVKKGGHYTKENIQMLAYEKNTYKAKAKKCKVIFIKDFKFAKITDFDCINDVMKEFGISSYNTINNIRDNGKIHYIDNGYSIIVQTIDGTPKQNYALYKTVFTKDQILVDYFTGKEYLIRREQYSFDSYGIWFSESKDITGQKILEII